MPGRLAISSIYAGRLRFEQTLQFEFVCSRFCSCSKPHETTRNHTFQHGGRNLLKRNAPETGRFRGIEESALHARVCLQADDMRKPLCDGHLRVILVR